MALTPRQRFEAMQRAVPVAFEAARDATHALRGQGHVLGASRPDVDRWLDATEQYVRCVRDLLDARDALAEEGAR